MGQGAITKERIFQVALEVFANHGFEGARMEKIAVEVGVNKASLYFHFKSKDEIFKELFRSILKKYQARLKAILKESENLPSKQRLIKIYEDYLDYNFNNLEMDFWSRIYYFPPEMIRDEVYQSTDEVEGEFQSDLTKVMEEGIRKKELKAQDPQHIAKAYYYILTCIGLSASGLFKKEEILKDMSDSFEVLWEGIKGI
jgi:AcrR family transcriptional regulator